MKLQSFIRENNQLIPVEVELTLWPGLPVIQFLGLPDQHLKESAFRIKSAIKSAGFSFPQAQQILVNLSPSHLKKRSRGLELAVAVAYLWETEQIPKSILQKDFFVYGELSLGGDVSEPEDLNEGLGQESPVVLTGSGEYPGPCRKIRLENLAQLAKPFAVEEPELIAMPVRPTRYEDFYFTKDQAQLIELLAIGEHSALLAGPSGCGKTTVAQAISGFLRAPSSKDLLQIQRHARLFAHQVQWRPLVQPHHSTPLMSMIGGGSTPAAGEISRAHGGVLILDELLEYSANVMEALRGPMEEGRISVARKGVVMNYPCRSLVIGTTNLCPCGDWTPELKMKSKCRFSLTRCRSYSQRLSGPIVDRFEIMRFMKKGGTSEIVGSELLGKVQKTFEFQNSHRGHLPVNAALTWTYFQQQPNWKEIEILMPVSWPSHRRRLAMLRVARSLADMDLDPLIRGNHIQLALEWTLFPFDRLQMSGA